MEKMKYKDMRKMCDLSKYEKLKDVGNPLKQKGTPIYKRVVVKE